MPAVEGGYVVSFPDFPEAFTQGEDMEECLTMGADVLSIAVEEYAKSRKDLPEPSTLQQVKFWAEKEKNSPGIAEGDMLFQLFQAPTMDLTPVRVSVSFSKSALEQIDRKASHAGFTRSGFLAHAAMQYEVQ
jgi:predicted RNase H-like HicB family nuclease